MIKVRALEDARIDCMCSGLAINNDIHMKRLNWEDSSTNCIAGEYVTIPLSKAFEISKVFAHEMCLNLNIGQSD